MSKQSSACAQIGGVILALLVGQSSFAQDVSVSTSTPDGVFKHNGSDMRIVTRGQKVTITYDVPDSSFRAIRRGDLLFEGHIVGNQLIGTAYRFKPGCAPFPYRVQGSVTALAQGRLILEGPAPVWGNGCSIQRLDPLVRDAALLFTAKSSAGSVTAQAPVQSLQQPPPASPIISLPTPAPPVVLSAPSAPPRTTGVEARAPEQRVSTAPTFSPQNRQIGGIDVDYAITAPGTCARVMTLRVTSRELRLFANGQALMQELRPQLAEYLTTPCPAVHQITVEGWQDQRRVYVAEMRREDGWQLTAQSTPIDEALNRLAGLSEDISALAPILNLLDIWVIRLGGRGGEDFEELHRRASAKIERISTIGLADFKNRLAELPSELGSMTKLTLDFEPHVATIERAFPALAGDYREAVATRQSQIKDDIVSRVARELETGLATWETATTKMEAATRLIARYGTTLPEAAAPARTALDRINRDVEAGLDAFGQELMREAATWESVRRLSQLRDTLEIQSDKIPSLVAYTKAATQQREKLLDALFEQAHSEVKSVGTKIEDIEGVLDLARDKGRLFTQAGSQSREQELIVAGLERVNILAETTLPEFRKSIEALPITPDTLHELDRIKDEYTELAASIPAFERYQEATTRHLDVVKRSMCESAKSVAGLTSRFADRHVLASSPFTLADLVCQVHLAGGAVSGLPSGMLSGLFSSRIDLTYTDREGAQRIFSLEPSREPADQSALIGKSETVDGRVREITREQWLAFITEATRSPPTGRPDRNGVTECDRLVSDPNDPSKRAEGVAIEAVEPELAVEACVAALERDPGSPRLLFLMGRALEAGGVSQDSRAYLEAAAAKDYAAAHAALGELMSLEEATRSVAITHLQKAVSNGYSAASETLDFLKAANMVDISKGWPQTGVVSLVCMTIETVNGPTGDLLFENFREFGFRIDLDRSMVRATENVRMNDHSVFKQGQEYKLARRGFTFEIGAEQGRYELEPNSLKLTYFTRVVAGRIFNLEVLHELESTGECTQNLE